ncbi:MAG: YbaB/EbfC family nucleoid-associated protein [Phototrophicales bacterium]|nr:YbaB/EbfC family nucleoid-associated protein [Phototrophicales bacterium]
MGKGKKKGGFGGGGMPDRSSMLRQLEKMQKDMEQAQAALETETLEVSVGGGAVTVVITGHQRVQEIRLNASAIDTTDAEWVNDLQDMMVVAVNQAIEQSQTMAAERLEGITGGLGGMPGMGGLFG